jgi:hypothetical protein
MKTRAMAVVVWISVLCVTLLSGVCLAADNSAGKWKLTATDAQGNDSEWVLELKTEDGKVTGTLTGDQGVLPLIEPKADDHSISFQVALDDVTYAVDLAVDGDKITGKYKGGEASGTIKGSRES